MKMNIHILWIIVYFSAAALLVWAGCGEIKELRSNGAAYPAPGPDVIRRPDFNTDRLSWLIDHRLSVQYYVKNDGTPGWQPFVVLPIPRKGESYRMAVDRLITETEADQKQQPGK